MTDELVDSVKQWTLEELVESPAAAAKKTKNERAIEWGFPGHLTKAELDIYVKFKEQVDSRGGEFRNTVFSFSEEEGDAYTLTRWLRARKYNLQDTLDMVTEATECRANPRSMDYYPDPAAALGVDPAVFISQYPQLYTGFSKTGCPVFYSKPGVLNIDGVECITTLDGILKYHWHVMQHDYRNRLLQFKKENPSFVRFECVSVLDLSDLTMSQLGSRTLEIIKKQATIDSLCFPETMNKMIIVNAPRFFTATWAIIKGFIDVRTVNKVHLYSSTSAASKKLKEIIDEDDLPSDYGGKATSTKVLLQQAQREDKEGGREKIMAEVMYVRSTQSLKVEVQNDEEVDIWVHTRSSYGSSFKVMDEKKVQIIPSVKVIHTGPTDDNISPSKVHLTSGGRIAGKRTFKVKAESLVTRMSGDAYLVVVDYYKT